MSHDTKTPIATNLILFNETAAARGDGLHPRLAEALQKTGSVSGPPAKSSDTRQNVIEVVFSDINKSARKIGSGRP